METSTHGLDPAALDPKTANILYHDKAADGYDEKWSIQFDEHTLRYVEERMAKVVPDKRVFGRALELGSGTGFFLQPGLFTNAQAFYAAAITVGGVVVAPGLFSNASLFFAPSVGRGSVAVAPPLLANVNQFFQPTVAQTTVLAPARLDNAAAFYSPTVTPGVRTLQPALLQNASQFYAAVVTGGEQVEPADFRAYITHLAQAQYAQHLATVDRVTHLRADPPITAF